MTDLCLPTRLVERRTDACELLAAAHGTASTVVDAAALSALVRSTLGLATQPAAALPTAVRVFAEQSIVQVSAVTPAMVADLGNAVAPLAVDQFVRALYVVEFCERLQVIAARLFPGDTSVAPPAVARADTVRAVMAEYQEAVVRGTALEPALTELVRLRCARTHRCTICSTLRLASARDAGVDESVAAKVDFYEASDLPEGHKVALRIVDAFINQPSALTPEVVAAARAAFTDEQLAELCLDITKWSTQKVNVALGTDGVDHLPVNNDGVVFFDFDEAGRVSRYSPF